MSRARPLLLAGMLLLAGCASQPDFDPDAAGRLQTEVLTVSTAAAENRLPDALAQLDAVRVRADAARDADLISEARYQRILAALAGVRADIEAAITEQEIQRLAAEAAEAARVAEAERIRLEQEAAAAQAEAQRIADQAEAQRIANEATAQNGGGGNGGNGGNGGGNGDEKGKPQGNGKSQGKGKADD